MTPSGRVLLYRGLTWGPWLVVITTGSLLPFEVVELARRPRAGRFVILVVNLAIVWYLAVRAARRAPATARSASAATRRRGRKAAIGTPSRSDLGLDIEDLHSVIRDIPKPVIAAVNGYAIGGGHVLHVICDLTIAAHTARFGQVEASPAARRQRLAFATKGKVLKRRTMRLLTRAGG